MGKENIRTIAKTIGKHASLFALRIKNKLFFVRHPSAKHRHIELFDFDYSAAKKGNVVFQEMNNKKFGGIIEPSFYKPINK